MNQLESAHSRGDLARVFEIAASLEQKALGLGEESLARLCGRLRSAEELVPEDLEALIHEAVSLGQRAVRKLRMRRVLDTPPGISIWRMDPRLRLV